MVVIEKNSAKVALVDMEIHSPHSRDTIMSSEYDDDGQRRNFASTLESDDDDDDSDSGAGSDDDINLLELGESGEEFCQIGDQTCSVPYELYDLPGLTDVLSLDVWNDVLDEEDRFQLSKYLPDMDQENYVHTLKQLFSGDNLHFGSPIRKLFQMLKGGMCEPRVTLYRQGLNFFQKRQHYHNLRKCHNTMVNNLHQIRNAWVNCGERSIEDKLRLWKIMKSQKNEGIEAFVSEPIDKIESGDALWGNRKKDRNLGQDAGKHSAFRMNSHIELSSRGQKSISEDAFKHGKRKSKKNSKLDSLKTAPELNLHPSNLLGGLMRSHRYGSSADLMLDGGIVEDEESESVFPGVVKRDGNLHSLRARAEEDLDSFMGSSTSGKMNALGTNRTINKLSDITMLTVKPSSLRTMNGRGKNINHDVKHIEGLKSNASLKGRIPLSRAEDPAWLRKHEEFFPTSFHGNSKRNAAKGKQWGNGSGFADGIVKGGMDTFLRNEDTESDSSKHHEYEDENSLMGRTKWVYPSARPELNQGSDVRKLKNSKKDKRKKSSNVDCSSSLFGKVRNLNPEGVDPESRGNMPDSHYYTMLPAKELEEHHSNRLGNAVGADERRQFFAVESNGYSDEIPSKKYTSNQEKKRKGPVTGDSYLAQSSQMYESLEDDYFLGQSLSTDNGAPLKLGKRNQLAGLSAGYYPDSPDMSLVGSNTLLKKRKFRHDLDSPDLEGNDEGLQAELQLEYISSTKKRGKTKLNGKLDLHENGVSQPVNMEVEMEDIETIPKRPRKSFPPITPSIPSNFSFSIVHLLSALRMAMVTMLPDDSDAGKRHSKNDSEEGVKEEQASKPDSSIGVSNSNLDVSTPLVHENVPSLSVQEIIERVRSNPGDPCILETQEPLQDLIRGVLKIFSSRTAPLGAKGWKTLVAYDKSKKCWSWIGPLSNSSVENEAAEEVSSPDAWGLPHKMLVKLVDAFANWLKNSQETLKQIGSLPNPPVTLMQASLDEKERFKDLRAQKSLSTINPSSEEVKLYFRKEEELRYQIPDRAFSYTAIDGKKSIVAPLRRCGGKPTSKARDHFMLKPDRPPHVTILCLVRDAASRLPGSIGTRADVCTLIRDSQYIVEDVSDTQVNQVVSGALDRLHYERDPCVQFDSERKLWVYLHREREEEDFEDDGTSSTKKWKRQKKETNEAMEQGDATVAYTGPDLVSDLNAEASFADDDKRSEPDDHIGKNAGNIHAPDDYSSNLSPHQ